MPPNQSTLSVICPWTVVLLFASFVPVAVQRITLFEKISEKQRRNSRILGVFLVMITVLLVSCTSNVSRSSSQAITLTPATAIQVKEPRIVLPVCDCEEFISSDESIVVRLRWGAKTRDSAEQGADFVVYTATVDGWSTFQKGYSATLQVTLHVGGASAAELIYLAELHPQSATVGRGCSR
jgi:hypothetical protein